MKSFQIYLFYKGRKTIFFLSYARKMSLEEEINREFRKFFDNCKKQKLSPNEMRIICKCLDKNNWWQQFKIELNFIILMVAIYYFYNNCEKFAWSITALGRILLIQLLPYWDWTPLYNKRCLIENSKTYESYGGNLAYVDEVNCLACENLGEPFDCFSIYCL